MQKFLVYVENYVEWAALSLGGLFLLFMVWSYVVSNPAGKVVSIQNKPTPVAPGNIDQLIASGPAADLARLTNQTHPDFDLPVPPVAPPLSDAPKARPAMAYAWNSFSSEVKEGPTPPPDNTDKVAKLPQPPALQYVDVEPLRTVLLAPDPGAPAPAPGQAPPAGTGIHVDADVVTTFWSLPIQDLANAYAAAFGTKIGANEQAALVAKSDMFRQEQIGPDKWGPVVVVARPFNVPPVPPYPPAGDGQQFSGYREWLIKDNDTAWFIAPMFPPTAYARPDLTWKPLDAWVPYRATQQAADAMPVIDAAPTPPPAPAPTPARRNGGGNGRQPVAPPAPVTPLPRAATPAAPDTPAVIPTAPKLLPAPGGAFMPAQLATQGGGDLGFFFHDTTAQPGRTYRYKVRYTLLNPIFGRYVSVAGKEMADQVGLDSPDSAWSPPVTVPTRTRFWCAAKQPQTVDDRNAGRINFNVFAWHDGQWRQKTFLTVPGDEVGGDQGPDGNYTTGWTLLDVKTVRQQYNGQYVLLLPDAGGDAQRREVAGDPTSSDYKKFMRDFNAQSGVGGGPGAPPGPPGLSYDPGTGQPPAMGRFGG